jgi:hypothetical protein
MSSQKQESRSLTSLRVVTSTWLALSKVKLLLGLLFTMASSRVFLLECLSVRRQRSLRLVVDTILDFSSAIKDWFIHSEKITRMDSLVWDTFTQQNSLSSSLVSVILESVSIQLSVDSNMLLLNQV